MQLKTKFKAAVLIVKLSTTFVNNNIIEEEKIVPESNDEIKDDES